MRRRADFKDTGLVLLLPADKLHAPSSEEHRFSTQDKLRGINTISWQHRCTRLHASLLLPLRLSLTRVLFPSLCDLVLQGTLVQLPLMLLPLKTNTGNCRSLTVIQKTLILSMNAGKLAHRVPRITTLKGLSLFSHSNCLF